MDQAAPAKHYSVALSYTLECGLVRGRHLGVSLGHGLQHSIYEYCPRRQDDSQVKRRGSSRFGFWRAFGLPTLAE